MTSLGETRIKNIRKSQMGQDQVNAWVSVLRYYAEY